MKVELTDREREYLLGRVGVECNYAFCACCPEDRDGDTVEAARERVIFKRALRRKLAEV